MDVNLACVYLFLVFSSVEQCTGRRGLVPLSGSLPQQSKPAPAVPVVPADTFAMLRNISSTDDFLVQMKLYQQESKKGVLPSQENAKWQKLKSRSSGNFGYAEFIDLNQQPCVLRPQIYFLGQPAPHENAFMWPYAVKLPRCAGSCSIRKDVLECRPSNKVQIPLVTYRVPYHSSRKRRDVMEEFARMEDPIHELKKRSTSRVQIIPATLEGHADCVCECTQTEKSCALQNKILNKDLCRCECKTFDQNCSLPFAWDDRQCKCLCNEDQKIMVNTCHKNSNKKKHWNHQKCACLCSGLSGSKFCPPATNTFDTSTCSCQCAANATQACAPHQSLQYGKGSLASMCYCK